MNKLSSLDWLTLILIIIGGLNWLLVGLFSFDLIAAIFGYMTVLARLIYILIGLSAIYLLFTAGKFIKKV